MRESNMEINQMRDKDDMVENQGAKVGQWHGEIELGWMSGS